MESSHGIIVSSIEKHGESWGDDVIRRATREKWSPEARLRLFLSLPKTEHFWNLLSKTCHDIEDRYWQQTSVFPISGTSEQIVFAVERLIAAGRANAAIHLAGQFAKKMPNPLIVRVLQEALHSEGPRLMEGNDAVMFQYYVEELMSKLDVAEDVPESEIGKLEWSYLRVLEHSRRPPKVIQKVLATSPRLLCGCLVTSLQVVRGVRWGASFSRGQG